MDAPIAVDWRYIPSADIGGDTFGYHWIDDDHFAFYLIDVTGHGLDSALLSVSVMNLLRSRSLANADFRNPGRSAGGPERHLSHGRIWREVLHHLVRRLSTSTPDAWFGPAAVIRTHCSSQIQPSDAAPPIRLESQGPMIGMIPWPEFETGQQTVPAGSRLYVYSDGVHEIHKTDGSEWTFEEYVEFLTQAMTGPSSAMDQLLQHVRQLHGCRTTR